MMPGSQQSTLRKAYEGESGHEKAIRALAWMVEKHLQREDGVLDNLAMSQGELAMEVLADNGLLTWLEAGLRLASWTEEGRKLLARYE